MENSVVEALGSNDLRSWRDRLEECIVDYCASNYAAPDDVVGSVSDFLRGKPTILAHEGRGELRHRMKNEMQLLLSSMRLRRRSASPGEADCDLCMEQVLALAKLNDVLDDRHSVDRVDLAGQCSRIVTAICKAYNLEEIMVEVEAEPIFVPATTARCLVLILNEALTNAIKHASGDDRGTARVMLTRTSLRQARLTVLNEFHGASSSGGMLGGTLMDALAAQIDARIDRVKCSNDYSLSCVFPIA